MVTRIKEFLRTCKENEDGVTLVEYGIGLLLAISVGAILLTGLGNQVSSNMSAAASGMTVTT